jgi:hypothetical protein
MTTQQLQLMLKLVQDREFLYMDFGSAWKQCKEIVIRQTCPLWFWL